MFPLNMRFSGNIYIENFQGFPAIVPVVPIVPTCIHRFPCAFAFFMGTTLPPACRLSR